MKLYFLAYDLDHGARESWNVFYTPMEVFDSEKARQDRKDALTKTNPALEFEERDLPLLTAADVGRPNLRLGF